MGCMAGVGRIPKTFVGRVYFLMTLFITHLEVPLTFPGQNILFSEVLQNRKVQCQNL